jgi:hypothetical protein
MQRAQLTAWGKWVAEQDRGIMTKAQHATGLAYSTIHAARTRRVRADVALALSKFTRGKVKAADISLPLTKNVSAA